MAKSKGVQESLRRSIIGEILPVFQRYPVITGSKITNVYAQIKGRPLSMKAYGYKKLIEFFEEVDFFTKLDNGEVKISKDKLLHYLLSPLESATPLEGSFEKVNGFPPDILCNFCGVDSLSQLIKTSRPQKKRGTVQHVPLPTPTIPALLPIPVQQQSFPNNGIHPKDESYLPALPGHPRIDLPSSSQNLPLRPVLRPGERLPVMIERVNAYISEFIIWASSQGKHLPVYPVTTEMNNINVKQRIPRNKIKAWDDFDKLYKRLDVFIRDFCWQCPFTSLYELERTILEFEKVSSFEELRMGPILKHPVLQDMFKIPNDLSHVPEITTYDILETLNAFVNKHKKGDNIWEKLEEFMDFFAKKYSVPSPQYLCVRVSSYRMALSCNFKYRTSQRQIRERREHEAAVKVDQAIDFEIGILKKSLRRMSQNERDLINKSPVTIIEEIFTISKDVLPPQFQSRLFTFFSLVLKDNRARKLFTAAVYQGAYGVQQYIQDQERIGYSNSSTIVQSQDTFCHKTQSELTSAIVSILQLNQFPISLETLARVEQDLLSQMSVSYFSLFHHGSFLEFIAKSDELLKCVGGRHIGERSVTSDFRRNRIFAFLNQLKQNFDDPKLLESALKLQFCVSDVEELACGGLDKLISDAKAISPSSTHRSHHPIISYTVPLVVNDHPKPEQVTTQSGYLGPQSFEDAFARLHKAPLLCDLSEWTQWDLVFAPNLGGLSDFLMKQNDQSFSESKETIYTLQDRSGRLLKIDPESDREAFVAAVETLNPIDAAGHLVSMAVTQTSINLMSTQLLAKCVTTKLEQVEGEEENAMLPERFVFHCLQRIPLELCDTLGKQVFIDSLRKVKSATTVNKLIELCVTDSQRCLLQALGIKLGINEWIHDFKEMKTTCLLSTSKKQHPNKSSSKVKAPITAKPPAHVASNQVIEVSQSPDTNSQLSDSPVDVSTSTTSTSRAIGVDEARRVIMTIREEEFGIGLELNQQQLKIANKQKEREGRGLQRLSQELYSKDTHFVLELIQNADDNTYNLRNHSVPTAKFILHNDCISVLNNEVGFSERNIRAICDVGKSTKDPSRSGYIGQKGIGFKSVFRVTNKPEIHSSGFHIQFDTTSGPIGYILPEWIQQSFIDGKIDSSELVKWTTQIVLPLRGESNVSQNMAKKFQDIRPSLLLFLNRLRSIIIYDTESDEEKIMVRTDKGNGVTMISHDEGIDRWLVARKDLTDASHYKPGVQTTELAIAFPLPEDFDSLPSARDLPSQQVFAFLPLRSYGFRFIVQGDFDLPSSREDVNEDSTWNQWLRENIPSLFIEASESIKGLSQLDMVKAISLFVQFIPLDGEVHDFFKPVTSQILRLLKGSKCLPTDPLNEGHSSNYDPFRKIMNILGNDDLDFEEAEVAWKQPSQLVTVAHDFIRDYIPQSVLASSLNLYYLNSSLAPRIGPDLCSHLGIGTISVDHLIEVANCVLNDYYSHLDCTSDSDSSSDDDDDNGLGSPFRCLVSWISYWLACVYTVLDEGKSIAPQTLENLKKLKIIPLMNETLVALDEVTVFFPPSNDADIDTDYKMIFTELKTVDDSLLETGDVLIQGKVYQMLSVKLGIKELNEWDIIDHHIIPQLKSQAHHQKKDKILILYLKFIKKCIDQRSFGEAKVSLIMEQLKTCVQVVTNKGIKSPNKDVVHFSSEYKEQWDLSKLFPGVKWTLLSSKYLERSTDVQSWKKFFIELGITAGLAVERINHSIDPNHQTEKVSIWDVSNWKRSQDGQYTVRDYYCREFDEIVDSVSSMRADIKFQQMETLANMLDKGWDARYKQYFVAQCFDGSNTHQLDEVLSSFGASIRDKAWLPAVDMQQQPYSPTPVLKGIDLYTHSKENTSLLNKHVPYLGVSLQNTDLLKVIKVKCSVTPSALMGHLKQWCVASRDGSFRASIDHMGEVYIFFHKHISDDIEKAFGEQNLIFIPSNTPQEGEFRSIHDCCWTDKTTVIYNMLRRKQTPPSYLPFVLSYYYYISNEEQNRKIKHAFLALGVNKLIKLKGLASLLDYNASLAPAPTADLVDNFTSIAHVVIESIFIPQRPDDNTMQYQSSELSSLNEPNRSYFIGGIKDNKVFPTTSKKWANVENLLVDDALEVSKHFLNSEKVYFLRWSQVSNSDLQKQQQKRFVEICRIPLLSQNARITFTPVGIRPFDELKRLFHHLIPLIQLYFVSRLPNVLTIERHQHICDLLAKLNFFSTIELNCSYMVRDELRVVKARQCHVDIEEAAVYAVVDSEGKYLEKSSLVGVIKDIVSFHQAMDSNFERFLQSLITDEPTSEESKKSVIERYELAKETTEFPNWSVDLPNSFVKVKKPSIDLEMEMADSNDSVDEDSVIDDTDTGLRAWPPKASAMVNSSSKKPTRIPTKDYETVPSTKDVMTSNDIAEMRRQAGQQDDIRQTTSSPALWDNMQQSSHKNHKGSMSTAVESLYTTQPNSPTRHPDKEGGTMKENHPIEGRSSSSGEKNENTREKGDLNFKSKSQSRQGSHLEPDDKKAVKTVSPIDFQNMEAMEISHLMHNIPLEGARRFDMPSDIEGMQESMMASGKWGEMFVHLMFKKQGALPNGLKIASIEWENEKDESGLPYDIKVTVQDGTVYFLEVKSTSSSNKELIPFSWKELKFAKEKAGCYTLIRVYNALSSAKVMIKWLPDMYQVIESNQSIRLFLKL